MPNKKIKSIPTFETLQEEQEFWETHSIFDFPGQFKRVEMDFSNLKPSTKSISIRLPKSMLESLKVMANKMDVPYQSLIKTFIATGIKSA